MPKIHKHPIGTYSVRWVEQLSDKSVRIHTTKGFKTRAEAVAYLAARSFTPKSSTKTTTAPTYDHQRPRPNRRARR